MLVKDITPRVVIHTKQDRHVVKKRKEEEVDEVKLIELPYYIEEIFWVQLEVKEVTAILSIFLFGAL